MAWECPASKALDNGLRPRLHNPPRMAPLRHKVPAVNTNGGKAAARTANVVQLPQLSQYACDGHLVAFLAINLFNAAIVMVVLALSDPLADAAQETKRVIARIYRLQGLLGARSSLSRQSLAVLRSLVMLLSHRESEAILILTAPDATHDPEDHTAIDRSMSVRNALSMRLGESSNRVSRSEIQSMDTSATQYLSRIDDGLASVQRVTIPNLDGAQQQQQQQQQQQDAGPPGASW